MNQTRRLLLVSATVFALGAVVATGAFTGGDEAVRGVYLTPAETANGDEYASIGATGELELSMEDLNPEATTVASDVFVIGTDLERARVWIEDDQPAVTFYRMDTGESIEQASDPVALTADESITVGVKVETGTDRVVLETITVRAEIPDGESSGGSSGISVPGFGGSSTATPTETVTATPTDEPASDTPSETPTDDTSTVTPTDETGSATPTDDTASATPTDDTGPGTDTTAIPTDGTGTDTATETRTETPDTAAETTGTDTPPTQTTVGGGAGPTETEAMPIQVVELTAESETPTVGQTVTVSGTFEHTGDTERTVTLQLRAGGDVIATETVTLAPGERHTVSGTVTFDEPGSYEIALGDSSITVSVEEAGGSLLEVGGFAPPLLGGLALVAAALLALAYLRSDDPTFVVTVDEESWSTLELVGDSGAATETDADGRTTLRFDLADGDGVVSLDPAFSVRNTAGSAVGLRMEPVDADDVPVTSGVTVQTADGVDLTGGADGSDEPTVLGGGETLSVRVTLDRDVDGVDRLATLNVEASPGED